MVAYGWLWLLMMNIGELLKHPQLVITIDDLKPPVCRISGMANFWEMFGDPKTEKTSGLGVGCWTSPHDDFHIETARDASIIGAFFWWWPFEAAREATPEPNSNITTSGCRKAFSTSISAASIMISFSQVGGSELSEPGRWQMPMESNIKIIRHFQNIYNRYSGR